MAPQAAQHTAQNTAQDTEDAEAARPPTRTAGEAGWHVSRYNLSAPIPNTKNVAIANIFKGNCASYTPLELYLLSVLEELDEHHPIIERFAKRRSWPRSLGSWAR